MDGPDQSSNRMQLPDDIRATLFDGCSGPLLLPKGHLSDEIEACLLGWPQRSVAETANPISAAAQVRKKPARFAVDSRFTDRPMDDLDAASAICSLIADMTLDWSETAPDVVGIHGGVVVMGGRALLITGPARAGKSTLISRLSMQPEVVFLADDVVPVDHSGNAVSLGVAPRLRLPVPNPQLAAFADATNILRDTRYQYFAPPKRLPFGQTVPLGGVVLIERTEGASAALYRLSHEDAVATLLRQSITSFADAADSMTRIGAILSGLPTVRLIYSDLDEAVSLLSQGLPTEALPDYFEPIQWSLVPENAAPLPPDQPVSRNGDAVLRRLGDRSWLWLPDDGMLWELNPVSAFLWDLLEIDGSAAELSEILAEAFPDQSLDRLTADTAAALGQMETAGLVFRL